MPEAFESEHSSIEENNAPLGWGLKLLILGFFHLCMFYAFYWFHTDTVSQDAPSTAIPHARNHSE